MRISRFAALAAAGSVLILSGLALAMPAAAAPPAGAVYVADTDIVSPAPFSNVGWGNPAGTTLTSSINGLSISNGTELNYGLGTNVPTSGGSALNNASTNSFFFVSNDNDVYARFLWYADAGLADPQYIFSVAPGAEAFTNGAATWQSTIAVGSIPAYTSATLGDFDWQLSLDPALTGASLHGVGLYSNGLPVMLTSFLAAGTISYFTPVPVSTAATSVGQVDFGTAGGGLTATTSGFVPGETVTVYLNTTQSTSDPIDIVADPSGTVTYTWVAPVTDMEVGTYAINFSTQFTSGLLQIFQFDVTAQAVAIAALPNAGTDTAAPAALGAMLLVGGAILAATARRRRAA